MNEAREKWAGAEFSEDRTTLTLGGRVFGRGLPDVTRRWREGLIWGPLMYDNWAGRYGQKVTLPPDATWAVAGDRIVPYPVSMLPPRPVDAIDATLVIRWGDIEMRAPRHTWDTLPSTSGADSAHLEFAIDVPRIVRFHVAATGSVSYAVDGSCSLMLGNNAALFIMN